MSSKMAVLLGSKQANVGLLWGLVWGLLEDTKWTY